MFDSASYSHDIDMRHRYTQVYIYIYFYQSFHHSSIHLCLTLENNENVVKTYSTRKTDKKIYKSTIPAKMRTRLLHILLLFAFDSTLRWDIDTGTDR